MNFRLIVFLVWTLGGTFRGAAQLSFEAFGDPFDARTVDLVWNVSVGKLPSSLDTLKVLPAVFSDEVVSNVIDLCQFLEPENVRARFRAVAQGSDVSYQEPHPEKPVLGKSLRISPASGYINYFNPTASSLPRTPIKEVPSQEQALDLAVKLLPKLGIRESELTHRADSKQFDYLITTETNGHFDKQQKKIVEEVTARGVVLFRQVNGVSFSGQGDCGGIRVKFGNNAQIKELALTWRNVKPEKTKAVANPAQIVERIKKGNAVIRLPEGVANPGVIKKLTITQARPYYFGFDGGERQKTIYPYVMLVATADTGTTNFVVSLNCPIFK